MRIGELARRSGVSIQTIRYRKVDDLQRMDGTLSEVVEACKGNGAQHRPIVAILSKDMENK